VLRVLSDILLALDSGDIAVLTLLDLSAAFDSTLLQRLQTSYGLGGPVLAWFTSFLNNRTQYVSLPTTRLAESAVLYGVPQGSVKDRSSDRSCSCYILLTCCSLSDDIIFIRTPMLTTPRSTGLVIRLRLGCSSNIVYLRRRSGALDDVKLAAAQP